MATGGKKLRFRTTNERDPQKYFEEALAGAKLKETVTPEDRVSYRLVGIWQQVWEQYQAQPPETHAEYEGMANEVWTRLGRGETVGRMLYSVAGYIHRYQIDQYPPNHRTRLVAAYLWGCLTGRTVWSRFGGKSNTGWASGGTSAQYNTPPNPPSRPDTFEHDSVFLLKKKHYEEVVTTREAYRDEHREDWKTEEGYR
jgi:hypothetical protein